MVAKYLETIKKEIKPQLDGFFSIFLIGERGVGKTKLLIEIKNKLIEDKLIKDEFFKEVEGVSEFEKELKKNNSKQILIFDLIENLSFQEQKKLFNLISTKEQNVLINIQDENGEKVTCPQLIFTSTKDLKFLYENNDFYTPFIDRIAQQVFIIPPLRKLQKEDLIEAWNSVLINMKFETIQSFLGNNKSIIDFISRELYLSGNFRDLEKLAITLWRALDEGKKSKLKDKDVGEILRGFKEVHEIEIKGEFFKIDKPADFMIKEFRKALTDWAEKKYEGLSRSELINKLEISEKTYYNWKNGL